MSPRPGPRRTRVLLARAALSVGLLARAGAAAEAPVQPPVAAPAECATPARWRAALEARLPPLLRTHPLIETLSARVERVGGAGGERYRGQLESSGQRGLVGTRSVHGATCAQVLEALSFIGALSLERIAAADAALDGAPVAPQPARGSEASPPGADALGAGPAAPAGRARLGVSAGARLAPGLMPGRGLDLGVAVAVAWAGASAQPLLIAGVYTSLPEDVPVAQSGQIRFQHWLVSAVGCPWRFPRSGPFGLRPCLDVDIGQTRGEGHDVASSSRRSAPWISAGPELRAEFLAWERLELAASLAGVVPFWRAHFLFTPGLVGYETPALGLRFGSSASVIF